MNSIAGTVMWLPVVGTRKAFFPLRLEDQRTKLEKEPCFATANFVALGNIVEIVHHACQIPQFITITLTSSVTCCTDTIVREDSLRVIGDSVKPKND